MSFAVLLRKQPKMTDQVDNQEAAPDVIEPTANEVEARNSGWVPKEEYHGDENKWVDADEFIRRGPLFEKINVQSRELKEVKKALDQLKAHHATVKEDAYKKAMAELKSEKREAFIDGDPDKIIDIDERIADLKAQEQKFKETRDQEVAQTVQDQVHPEFAAWQTRNAWYTTNGPMRAYADRLGTDLAATGLSPSEVLKKVELLIKEEFPQKFRNPNRDKAAPVEGSAKGGTKGGADIVLSDLERNIMERFARQGIMTREQYKADLKKTRDQ
jgi:hypothetical protein